MRKIAFIDPRLASEVVEVEGVAAGEVLLLAVDLGAVLEPVAVLEAMVEPEDIVDIAVELTEVLEMEDDSVAVPLEVPFFLECE